MTSQLWNDIQAINDIRAVMGQSPVTEETFKRKATESDTAFQRRVRNFQVAQYETLRQHTQQGLLDLQELAVS